MTRAHGGMHLLHLRFLTPGAVDMSHAQHSVLSPRAARRYHRGLSRAIPAESPGFMGHPTRATAVA
ncbi:MAG: hypothetical protein HY337_05260 [Gemmatimonadetes bacterium]|nr:hypothetical protein [Gemmatimonadota bacterium]